MCAVVSCLIIILFVYIFFSYSKLAENNNLGEKALKNRKHISAVFFFLVGPTNNGMHRYMVLFYFLQHHKIISCLIIYYIIIIYLVKRLIFCFVLFQPSPDQQL